MDCLQPERGMWREESTYVRSCLYFQGRSNPTVLGILTDRGRKPVAPNVL
jgi:hypothetical protein